MILVDTSVWIDHLCFADPRLSDLLHQRAVLAHPFVIRELALGQLRQREIILGALGDLPQASVATDAEMLHFINGQTLFGLGIGYLDAHLLAATRLRPGTRLWTRDRRLHAAALRLSIAMIEQNA